MSSVFFAYPDAAVPDKFVIANSSSFHPYSFLGENGNPQGLLIDYWKEIEKQTGTPVEFILTDWAEGLDNVKTAKADIHAGLFYTDERDEYLNYTINNFDKDRRDLIIQKWIQTVSKTPDWLIPLIAVIIIFFISAFIAVYIFTLKKTGV